MSKLSATILAVVCATLGLIFVAMAAGWFSASFFGYGVANGAVTRIVIEGTALQKMHAGDIDGAAQVLEKNLDTDLVAVSASMKQGFKLTPAARASIGGLKRLRESTGYAPEDATVRTMVNEVLALASDQQTTPR